MNIVIMAGGTGGHVFPALAVAQELRNRGHRVSWIGTQAGLEAKLVPQQGFPIEWISIGGLRGKNALTLVTAPFKLLLAVLQALGILRRLQPALVLGLGGFAAGPGGLAAWMLRRPLAIHEQNAVAGYTNRLLARIASRVLQAFPDTFGAEFKAVAVGNPVRSDIAQLPPPAARAQLRSGPVRVLVLGGSLGAKALNTLVPQALARLAPEQRPEVWHQAGRTLKVAQQHYFELAKQMDGALRVTAFIDDMAAAYAWADLVICRAGALTIAELAAAGLAAILVPFPHAVDDHQTVNGQYLVQVGAALMIQERDLTPALLANALQTLLADRGKLLA
ncbi:MAG: undecaprenyldiphospho-muramoylpentapeptide beta-N-acetylglucosaminyltransferase, partial [Nevskiales bacterium]